ncbi:MAG TPA: flagellar hook assembly protein FlgD [Rhodanobacteraceae bacterium]|nr:flagellar hook assembly protein FlgD [Rhodanobacteraceae bacterium]
MPVTATQPAIDPAVLAALNATSGPQKDAAGDLQNNFMTMLITQLKNQDPLNPMDNSQMTAQLAQINTVSGIQDLNKTLQSITGQIDTGQTLQAAALIGKGVLVPGSRVLVGSDGTTTPFGFELAAPADSVQVAITDGSGQVVRSYDLGAEDAGTQSFTWDGTLADGTPAPQGAYSVAIKATSAGKAVTVTSLNYALVTGISHGTNGPLLDLGGIANQVGLGDIRQIL